MKGKKTGGRRKGSKNKLNRQKELQKAAESGGKTPLEYMLEVMRDPKAADERRDEMAKAAAPYVHARRAPEDKQGRTVPPMIYHMPNLESDE
jgi:hypothetical protein